MPKTDAFEHRSLLADPRQLLCRVRPQVRTPVAVE
jgi:hypothetical protein